MFKFIFDQLS